VTIAQVTEAQVAERRGIVRVDADRCANQALCLAESALLKCDDAEQMRRIEVPG
jgi:hypothetical protein